MPTPLVAIVYSPLTSIVFFGFSIQRTAMPTTRLKKGSCSAGYFWTISIITYFNFIVPHLPDPPKPVIGPVPLEGVSPSVIDQSNRSSVASFLHWHKPLSKEHFPEIYKSENSHIYLKSSGALCSTRSPFSVCLIVLMRWSICLMYVSEYLSDALEGIQKRALRIFTE